MRFSAVPAGLFFSRYGPRIAHDVDLRFSVMRLFCPGGRMRSWLESTYDLPGLRVLRETTRHARVDRSLGPEATVTFCKSSGTMVSVDIRFFHSSLSRRFGTQSTRAHAPRHLALDSLRFYSRYHCKRSFELLAERDSVLFLQLSSYQSSGLFCG